MAQKKKPSKPSSSSRKAQARAKTTRGGTTSRRGGSSKSSKTSRGTRQKKTRRTPQEIRLSIQQKALIVGIATVFLTVVLVLSLLSPNQAQLTSALATLLWRLFGWGGAVVPVVTGAVGLYLVLWGMEQPPTLPLYRLLGFGLLFLVLEAFA
ncbi:MAG: hypothetical protein KC425_26830, partial [Anaerolineales bacterium]|nr:hypothetical protein [Anaerolineales bacterium]